MKKNSEMAQEGNSNLSEFNFLVSSILQNITICVNLVDTFTSNKCHIWLLWLMFFL